MIRYKACLNSIATLKLLPDSKTNENRFDVFDPNFAKFRTNKCIVLDLTNPITNIKYKKDVSMYDRTLKYKIGKTVKIRFYNNNPNKICARGIHYFKTYDAAVSWFYRENPYTSELKYGTYGFYRDNGRIYKEYEYYEHHRKLTVWYEDGQKKYEIDVMSYNRIKTLDHKEWHNNGQIISSKFHKINVYTGFFMNC